MNSPTQCLECSAPLAPADAGGLCPKCLLRLGLATQLAQGTLPATARGLRGDGTIEEPFDFGSYRILRLLGKGGMGAVYEAEQHDTGRRVALKVLGQTLDTEEMRARFVREGQLAAAVRHDNVVAVLGAEEIEGTPVIAMELLHGGTLRDGVKKRGPLPVAEAVDAVLQIIAGLEAAHAAGVLHRDVKPANCFTSADGTVKVGDFGLSISTLVQAENSLTRSGAVLGTPAFAAPEQLRGQEIDARADIYAVGATLYFLFTGRPAYEAETLVALIAEVLEKKPADPRALRPELPRAVAAVVMRCLEKDPVRRFATYAALRSALTPFGSAAPTPAMLGLRFAAGLLDMLLAGLPVWVLPAVLLGNTLDTRWLESRTAGNFAWVALEIAWIIAWFAVPEALWGKSAGKAFCGLRVVRRGGGAPGWGAALARAAIFWTQEFAPWFATAAIYSQARYHQAVVDSEILATEWPFPLLFLVLFLTMRRANGFAALHDLATGTRVVSDHAAEEADIIVPVQQPFEEAADAARVGPFVVISRDGEIADALDPVLRRRVWIRFVEEGTPPLDTARREVSRVTRLRWLQGRRAQGENWDAFEQPDGAPLTRFCDAQQPWSRVRVWLADLADELHLASTDGTPQGETARDRVWLTAAGRAVLLDFPCPGAAPMPVPSVRDAAQMQSFLHGIATATASPRVPLHAREFLTTLRERRLDASALIVGNLRALLTRPAITNPRRRALSCAIPALIALSLALSPLGIFIKPRWDFDAAWQRAHPGIASPRLALELLESEDARALPHRNNLTAHLARKHGDAVLGDAFWEGAEMKALLEIGALSRFSAESAIATEVARQRASGAPTPDVEPLLERQAIAQSAWFWTLKISMHILAAFAVIATLLAFILRGPLGLRMFGLAVVRADGALAGRFRNALRAFIAWSPVLVAALLLATKDRWFWEPAARFPFTGIGVITLMSFYWLSGIAAGRGPSEKVTRTWIVPR